ncbi:hypothetical protein M758_7G175600, partial [Ceratodon purpureus]
LKQAEKEWYHHLQRFLSTHGFTCHKTLLFIFVLRKDIDYVILLVYGSRTSFGLGLQVHHLSDGSILLHQETYVKKLKHFNIANSNPISAPMIGRSKAREDLYRPCEKEEEEL